MQSLEQIMEAKEFGLLSNIAAAFLGSNHIISDRQGQSGEGQSGEGQSGEGSMIDIGCWY